MGSDCDSLSKIRQLCLSCNQTMIRGYLGFVFDSPHNIWLKKCYTDDNIGQMCVLFFLSGWCMVAGPASCLLV